MKLSIIAILGLFVCIASSSNLNQNNKKRELDNGDNQRGVQEIQGQLEEKVHKKQKNEMTQNETAESDNESESKSKSERESEDETETESESKNESESDNEIQGLESESIKRLESEYEKKVEGDIEFENQYIKGLIEISEKKIKENTRFLTKLYEEKLEKTKVLESEYENRPEEDRKKQKEHIQELDKGYKEELEKKIKAVEKRYKEELEGSEKISREVHIKVRERLESNFKEDLRRLKDKKRLVLEVKKIINGSCEVDNKALYEYDWDDLRGLTKIERVDHLCLLAHYPKFFAGIPAKLDWWSKNNVTSAIFSKVAEGFKTYPPISAKDKAENIIVDGLKGLVGNFRRDPMLTTIVDPEIESSPEMEPNGRLTKDKPGFNFNACKRIHDYTFRDLFINNDGCINKTFEGYEDALNLAKEEAKKRAMPFLDIFQEKLIEKLERKEENEKRYPQKKEFVTTIKNSVNFECKLDEEKLYEYELDDLKALGDMRSPSYLQCLLANHPSLFAGIPTRIKDMNYKDTVDTVFSRIPESLLTPGNDPASTANNVVIQGLAVLYNKWTLDPNELFQEIVKQDDIKLKKVAGLHPTLATVYKDYASDKLVANLENSGAVKVIEQLEGVFKGYENEIKSTIETRVYLKEKFADFEFSGKLLTLFEYHYIRQKLEKESKNKIIN